MQYIIMLAVTLLTVVSISIVGACTAYVVAQNHVYE